MKKIMASVVCVAAAFTASVAWAAPVSTPEAAAGRAERTGEDARALSSYYKYSRYKDFRPQAPDISVKKETPAEEKEELRFEVKEIHVSKSELLTDEEIREAVRFKTKGPMTVSELTEIVDDLNALYEKKGIRTAQAVLPPQTIKDGVVFIRLIEGRYGEVSVEGNHRVFSESILSRVKISKGELVDIDGLQSALRLYNSTNTYRLSAELVPGKEEGTSDVRLMLHEPENPWTSFIFTDNAGQKESGRYRIGAYSEYRGIGGHDAALAVAPVWSEGVWGGSVMYDTPLGHRGTRATVSYSRNLVDIIDGAFKDFDMKANSNDIALGITHPLNVTELSKVDFFVEGHRKWSDTEYSGMELADTHTSTVKTGISARSFDENGMWFAMGSVTGYRTDRRMNAGEGAKEGGSYYNAYLLRRQNLPDDRYLLYRVYGQYTAFGQLPATEQMSLGGMATVRGYRESLLSGDKGWYASMEYSVPISADHKTWRGFAFLDHGVAYNNYGTRTEKDFLTGTGIGLEYAKGGWYGKAVLGIPLNDSGNLGDNDPRLHFYVQRNV